MPGFSPKFIIDTGRNGVPDARSDCGNWCNIRGAGIGLLPTVEGMPDSRIDSFQWLKTPGESDGCSQTLPDGGGACPRYDGMCGSTDSLGTRTATEPFAPEAGHWFEYQILQLAANANLGLSVSDPCEVESTTAPVTSLPTPAEPTLAPTPAPMTSAPSPPDPTPAPTPAPVTSLPTPAEPTLAPTPAPTADSTVAATSVPSTARTTDDPTSSSTGTDSTAANTTAAESSTTTGSSSISSGLCGTGTTFVDGYCTASLTCAEGTQLVGTACVPDCGNLRRRGVACPFCDRSTAPTTAAAATATTPSSAAPTNVILIVVFPGDLSSINAEAFAAALRAELAVLLGVDPSQVTIVLRSGSIVADVSIAVGSASEGRQVESRVTAAVQDETEVSLLVEGQGHTAAEFGFGLAAGSTTIATDLNLATSESDEGSDSAAAAAVAAVVVCIVLAASIAAFVVIRQRRNERKPVPELVVENTALSVLRPLTDHSVPDADKNANAGGLGCRSDSYENALDEIGASPARGIGGTAPQYDAPTELPAPAPMYAPVEAISGSATGTSTGTVEVFEVDPKTNSVRLRSIARSNPTYRDSFVGAESELAPDQLPAADGTSRDDDARSEI